MAVIILTNIKAKDMQDSLPLLQYHTEILFINSDSVYITGSSNNRVFEVTTDIFTSLQLIVI